MRARKIAIEEHFGIPELLAQETNYQPGDGWDELKQQLSDLEGKLIPEMDRWGIEKSVMSLTSGGIQTILESKQAVETARRANDYIANLVAKRGDRLQSFAALPLQDPEAAALELTRSVKELGLVGGLVNGFTQLDEPDNLLYYDLPQFWPFWEQVEKLGVPVYIHPRYLPKGRTPDIAGHPWISSSAWWFGVNTATHALRLMGSGLFDKYPKLTVILGHLGETIPHCVWRIDHRVNMMRRGVTIQKSFAEYLRENFYVTTSGNFCTTALVNVISVMGAERVLFATDYPYEHICEAADWFDRVGVISESDWAKIARGNAEQLLKL